jgi:hypothetical protein
VFDRDWQFGRNDGFDDSADPPWLLLPAEQPVRMMQVENGEGLTLVSNNEPVAFPVPANAWRPEPVKITQQTQRFKIVRGVIGNAEIRAVDKQGRIHARLAVSVLPKLTVKCAFHYVRNKRYGTRRERGAESLFVDALNGIWKPQANIEFVQIGDANEIDMEGVNLGDKIDTQAKFDAVASSKHRDSNAQFNVFFVHEVEMEPNDVARTRRGPPGDCLFEDDIKGTEDTAIAHEAGHCLTLDHNSPVPTTHEMLMWPVIFRRFLPRVHVLQARRAVRR